MNYPESAVVRLSPIFLRYRATWTLTVHAFIPQQPESDEHNEKQNQQQLCFSILVLFYLLDSLV